jgi:uncharacterized protein YyaL (SSP411 family)
MSSMVAQADRVVRGSTDVVLVGPRTSAATQALARAAFGAYLPDRTIAWLDRSDPRSVEACGVLAEGKPEHGEPAAFVCRGRVCSAPLHHAGALRDALVR